MLTNIVVHPGKAHLDDFLSVAFLLYHYSVDINVFRRNPTPADLNSPQTAVIDQGGKHVPALLNFDHHQFDKDAPPQCALSLVLQHLGLYGAATETNWLRYAETYDSKGPDAAANLVGCDRRSLKLFGSPIESAVLEIFGSIGPEEPLPTNIKMLMFSIANVHINRWERVTTRLAQLPTMLDLHSDGNKGLVAALNMPPEDKPLLGLESYFQRAGLDPILSVVASERDPGCWVICRRHGFENIIDLRELPGCQFAHAQGFLAVTCQMEYQDAVAIACEAMSDASRAVSWDVPQNPKQQIEEATERVMSNTGLGPQSDKRWPYDFPEPTFPDPVEHEKFANDLLAESPPKPVADGLEDYGDAPEDYSTEEGDFDHDFDPEFEIKEDAPKTPEDIRYSSQHAKPWHGQKRGDKPFFDGVSGVWDSETGPVAIVAQTKQVLSLAWLSITGVKLNTNRIQNVEIHPAEPKDN